jgi:hypothetical protein
MFRLIPWLSRLGEDFPSSGLKMEELSKIRQGCKKK